MKGAQRIRLRQAKRAIVLRQAKRAIVLRPMQRGLVAGRNALLSCSIMISVSVIAACSPEKPPPEVTTGQGETLQGAWEGKAGDIAAFKGVPFAVAPIGNLRWRAPVENKPRPGVQSAHEFAPACMQNTNVTDWYAQVAKAFGASADQAARPNGTSEDCLYLNIWTPQPGSGATLPVMVYVHGGSNRAGWSYEPNYWGERLASKDVVVVTIAYRLGPLGFFSHPALDNGDGQPEANFGLLDIGQAFRWVRSNIASFGGNADNITGFGESAGAGNLLDWAIAANDSERLVSRLIAQSTSGSLDGRRSLDEEQTAGLRLLAGLGFEGNVTQEQLRAIPAADLIGAVDTTLPGHYFEAVVDGLTISQQLVDALRGGRGADIELLIGTNADEWLMDLDLNTSTQDVQQWIRQSAPEFAGSLLSSVAAEEQPRKALDRLRTAREMLCPSRFIAATASAQGGQGFVYHFTRKRSGPGGAALGAYHGAELPYVFDQHDTWLTTEPADEKLTRALMDYWVAFASSGNPRSSNQPGWPVYAAGRSYVMDLGDRIGIAEPHDADLCHYLGPRAERP